MRGFLDTEGTGWLGAWLAPQAPRKKAPTIHDLLGRTATRALDRPTPCPALPCWQPLHLFRYGYSVAVISAPAFDLPLAPVGTEFQIRCWEALLQVPYGETRSYGDIARAAGSPKGFRAVGMANNRNPIAIIIPCHRIIGSNGKLVGYGGGLDIKEFLLELERKNARS